MASRRELSRHDEIKAAIIEACRDCGFDATQEYRGNGWRADVLAAKDAARFAFEVQLSPQSLNKTLDRQAKYTRDGITGCWLFEKPPSKLLDERPDLPLFSVTKQIDASLSVSLGGRREISLCNFLDSFLSGSIRFCETARTKPLQHVKLAFFEMACWKCKAMNHVYDVDTTFYSACNAVIRVEEALWGSKNLEYWPDIVQVAREFIKTAQGRLLRLGEIKRRVSRTVQDSYVSFGCYACDAIFGDWFVMEAQLDAACSSRYVTIADGDVKLDAHIHLPIPHWCYPGELPFCDSK